MIYPIRSPRCAEFVGILSACAHIVVQTSLDRLSSSARWRIPPHLAPAGHARRSNTLTNCLPQLERLIASYSFRKHHQIGQVPMSPLLTWPEAISPAEFPTGSAGFFAAELSATKKGDGKKCGEATAITPGACGDHRISNCKIQFNSIKY